MVYGHTHTCTGTFQLRHTTTTDTAAVAEKTDYDEERPVN